MSGYPSNTVAANISKDTTARELLSIEGIDKEIFMEENMNCLYGKVNAVTYCINMLNFPSFEELETLIEK